MKTRFCLSFAAVLLFAVAAVAQPRMASPEDQAKQLKEQLKLSDTQVVEVTKILKDQRDAMTKMREKMERGPEMRDAFMKLTQETDEKMAKILNEDQRTAYKKLMEERRQARGQRRSG